jgi:ATP phosphoribosyltransferase regulatory subunit
VLSGGRYDKLMRRLGRRSDAIGFAVYLDRLVCYAATPGERFFDAVVLYDDATDLSVLTATMERYSADGGRVAAARAPMDGMTVKETIDLRGEGV